MTRTAALWALALPALAALTVQAGPPPPDFSREIRPILSQRCFKCHGPDDRQRQAGLRLDRRADALARLASGTRAVVPGKPGESELVRRILATGASQMPPAHANLPLNAAEKERLRRWVASGAEYRPHWAFVPVRPPAASGPQSIDAFVRARLAREKLSPSPEADRYTLLRRASLDLTGLPPSPEEVNAFLRDRRPGAYERVVDRLLASPRYGERWARRWLDLARYADTNGYEKDKPRSLWPYRDWVIRALNDDMPFDQFTVRQLAGDLLPGATAADRIATGFHRNTMLNEEGGIDPLEYRFHAMTDRMATTGTTWLGLTLGCAQCHSHKYDPVSQRDYYRLMAFLDNADEPSMDVPDPAIQRRREEGLREIARQEAALPERWPVETPVRWGAPVAPGALTTRSGALAQALPDGSVRISGVSPEADAYTLAFDAPGPAVALRLEALADEGRGPGRTAHGNFVLTELKASVDGQPVRFVRADADVAQEGFPAGNALDGDPKTGWAVHRAGEKTRVDRAAVFFLGKPAAAGRWSVTLAQDYGGQHTLGRFRLTLASAADDPDPRPEDLRRRESFDAALGRWLAAQEARAVRWQTVKPARAKANLPLLTLQPDGSVFSTGDQTKRDVYDLDFRGLPRGVTALRLEALADDRLPRHGPGRIDYEGPHGDFRLSEARVLVQGQPLAWKKALASFGDASVATDGNPQTAWSVDGGQGRSHTAVFTLARPLESDSFRLSLLFEWYYAAGLGRFRVAVSTDPRAGDAALDPATEEALTLPAAQRTPAQRAQLVAAFVRAAPELAPAREAIEQARRALPPLPTTLVLAERPANNPRPTYLRHRGEFLQPREAVSPGIPAFLPGLPQGAPRNRLAFARWLVAPENPLTARVAVNRAWAAFFGRGLVRTVEDFGYQGEAPSHPELLDYLAWTFVHADRWSQKKLHRRIVLSAVYRQSSRVTPALLARDPQNRLLARGPRARLDAEQLRDQALAVSGLLSAKIGGPSVFPPQPPGVTTEGTYGPLEWKVSPGEDRYRRGLYTFAKRTAPYAMFATFDAPSGEACLARREVSNTPLQALTLLNNEVFLEAAQALGERIAAQPGTVEEKASALFLRVLSRPPLPGERSELARFFTGQAARLRTGELPAPLLLTGPGRGDPAERAAWKLTARLLLNLDEAIVKR